MNRLQLELRRLYLFEPNGSEDGEPNLIDPANRVRALVLELTRPPSWEALGAVWQGVQTELELPAPAIAVSGVDALQLWFSLAEPVAVSRGRAFLDSLVARFLPGVAARRIRLWPAAAVPALWTATHARPVPAEQGASGNWSAFIAADLAPVFADTPWLDIPPGEEGQTNLLRGLRSIAPAALEAASTLLAPLAGRASVATADRRTATSSPPQSPTDAASVPERTDDGDDGDPRRFLRQVMNDAAVPLALRIEAAKALLSRTDDRLA